jgi:hypothetical protein
MKEWASGGVWGMCGTFRSRQFCTLNAGLAMHSMSQEKNSATHDLLPNSCSFVDSGRFGDGVSFRREAMWWLGFLGSI